MQTKEERATYEVEYRANHKDNKRAYDKEWYKRNKGKKKQSVKEYSKTLSVNDRRWITLKFKYGITREDYKKMWIEQKGCCAICGTFQTKLKKPLLVVDHCHNSNTVRGLLCKHCNSAIGMCKDNTDILRNAITYLEKWKSQTPQPAVE